MARATRSLEDVREYSRALMTFGSNFLQGHLGTGRDAWQNLMYRHALKEVGGGSAGLDLRLPHRWGVVGSGSINFGAARVQLAAECRDDPETHEDDSGLHPFFDRDARPLTFKESIQARMDQFDQSGGKDWSLWTTWLDSCTAIVWEAGGRRFKIVPGVVGTDVGVARDLNPLLMTLPANVEYLPANFENTPGEPLTVDATYGRALTFDEVVTHLGWLAAVEGDVALLRRYATTAFARMGRERAMGFYTTRSGLPDHLRPLCAYNLYDNGYCSGIRGMDGGSRFARVRPL